LILLLRGRDVNVNLSFLPPKQSASVSQKRRDHYDNKYYQHRYYTGATAAATTIVTHFKPSLKESSIELLNCSGVQEIRGRYYTEILNTLTERRSNIRPERKFLLFAQGKTIRQVTRTARAEPPRVVCFRGSSYITVSLPGTETTKHMKKQVTTKARCHLRLKPTFKGE
jgi:hypothetical protein